MATFVPAGSARTGLFPKFLSDEGLSHRLGWLSTRDGGQLTPEGSSSVAKKLIVREFGAGSYCEPMPRRVRLLFHATVFPTHG